MVERLAALVFQIALLLRHISLAGIFESMKPLQVLRLVLIYMESEFIRSPFQLKSRLEIPLMCNFSLALFVFHSLVKSFHHSTEVST